MKKTFSLILIGLLGISAHAEGFSKTINVKVSSSEPIYSTVTEYASVETCQDVKEPVNNSSTATNIVGTVVGGALGGVLGHQIGGGRGKDVATVGGAILGSIAGNKMTANNSDSSSYRIVKQCDVKQVPQEKTIISGYKNKGYLEGNEITVFSTQKLDSIPVSITYSY